MPEDGSRIISLSACDRSGHPLTASTLSNGLVSLLNNSVSTLIGESRELLPSERGVKEKMLGLLAADLVRAPVNSLDYVAKAGKRIQTKAAAVATRERELQRAANDKARAGDKAAAGLEPEAAEELRRSTGVAATK